MREVFSSSVPLSFICDLFQPDTHLLLRFSEDLDLNFKQGAHLHLIVIPQTENTRIQPGLETTNQPIVQITFGPRKKRSPHVKSAVIPAQLTQFGCIAQ